MSLRSELEYGDLERTFVKWQEAASLSLTLWQPDLGLKLYFLWARGDSAFSIIYIDLGLGVALGE